MTAPAAEVVPAETVDDPAFTRALAIVLRHEGGYVADPRDRGGETKFGISRRQYPELDIAKLTQAEAAAIYRRDYWLRPGIDRLPAALAPKVLDTAVLVGPATAIRLLQEAAARCGHACQADGTIGPLTLAACEAASVTALLAAYRALLAAHFTAIVTKDPRQTRFLKGWLARAAE